MTSNGPQLCRASELPEHDLILLCARTHADNETQERMKALLGQPMDWRLVTQLAQRHRVMPLLHNSLVPFSTSVPADSMAKIRRDFLASARRSQILMTEMTRLLALFQRHGIDAIPFKGPMLALDAYGAVAMKPFRDLDILLHKQDVPRAATLLLQNGYKLSRESDMAQVAARMRNTAAKDLTLAHLESGVTVELHWAFGSRDFPFALDYNGLFQHKPTVAQGGVDVIPICPEEMLLVLCVHGARHCWSDLTYVCDVNELIRAHPDMDWARLMHLAREIHARRIMGLGLILARDLLDASLPAAVQAEVNSDKSAQYLSEKAVRYLFDTQATFTHRDELYFKSQLWEHPRELLQFLWFIFNQICSGAMETRQGVHQATYYASLPRRFLRILREYRKRRVPS